MKVRMGEGSLPEEKEGFMKKSLRDLMYGALLSALAFVSMYLIQIPIFPAAPYLQFDPSEIFSLFAAFFISPLMGVLVTLVKVILFYLVKQNGGIIGSILNFLAVSSFVYVAGVIYRRRKSFLLPLVMGTLVRVVVMIPSNIFFLPLYLGVPVKDVAVYLYSINIPFNVIVSGINGFLFVIIVYSLRRIPELKKILGNA